ncbi:TetR/AcrR family transcriptional regulator [Aliikangiella coralliicola]|uniref:TetR/AcrR family transcriptional regulator n=1 Tax=Aliikangiella coralliicola TaxID=2592383 RepID=A0A545UG34_9GAMM|nr:TetR/AcrR family transcriptional regulator [Aliikangiella coralliicola]TQV88437.1 TetR/AcrR family transcriptional regulator [Aliikangiella coralliicola]
MNKAAQTRQIILTEALNMATHTCLSDVTIGALARSAGLSKSGLFAHFNSKENLQVAVIEYASELFAQRVIKPVDQSLGPVGQIRELANNWLNWFDGYARSCIFIVATVEFDDQPGPVRDVIFQQLNRWVNYLEKITEAAIAQGEFQPDTDGKQFVYELYSLYQGSHMFHWLKKEDEQRTRFHTAFNNLIEKHMN